MSTIDGHTFPLICGHTIYSRPLGNTRTRLIKVHSNNRCACSVAQNKLLLPLCPQVINKRLRPRLKIVLVFVVSEIEYHILGIKD